MHEVQTMYGSCDFPDRKAASPPSAPKSTGLLVSVKNASAVAGLGLWRTV